MSRPLLRLLFGSMVVESLAVEPFGHLYGKLWVVVVALQVEVEAVVG